MVSTNLDNPSVLRASLSDSLVATGSIDKEVFLLTPTSETEMTGWAVGERRKGEAESGFLPEALTPGSPGGGRALQPVPAADISASASPQVRGGPGSSARWKPSLKMVFDGILRAMTFLLV